MLLLFTSHYFMIPNTILPHSVMDEVAKQIYPKATLYVLATPIGNFADITLRGIHILSIVDSVACEDTRNTAQLLNHFGLSKPLLAAHEHNEQEVAQQLIARLQKGERIALVSDAGTPAISDPGARIVDAVINAGLRVMPIPGPSAAITALSASGLYNNQFYFVGFLPSKSTQRLTILQNLSNITATLVFYEAPHRIVELSKALSTVFEPTRTIIIARELTKLFEEIHRCPLSDVHHWLAENSHRQKGEFVVLLEGASINENQDETESLRVLTLLLNQCPLKQAVALAAEITGQKKNKLYEVALQIKENT